MRSQSVSQGAQGASGFLALVGTTGVLAPPSMPLLPSVMVALSAGASLTYNIEATLDGINWAPLSQNNVTVAQGLTAGSFFVLQGVVLQVRVNVTSWSSGIATLVLGTA